MSELRTNKTYKFKFDEGDVICHNIYSFAEIVAKGNPQWVEVCSSKYVIGDLSLFTKYNLNPSALKGMVMEKVHAFQTLYPSREKFVKEFGYDPKQLHHIIRLYDTLSKGVNVYSYEGEERDRIMDIKRGRFPANVDEALALRDRYVMMLGVIYEKRKVDYKKQGIDYEALDEIVRTYMCKGL